MTPSPVPSPERARLAEDLETLRVALAAPSFRILGEIAADLRAEAERAQPATACAEDECTAGSESEFAKSVIEALRKELAAAQAAKSSAEDERDFANEKWGKAAAMIKQLQAAKEAAEAERDRLRADVGLAVEACRDFAGLPDGACRFAVLSILAPQPITEADIKRGQELWAQIEAEKRDAQ
jgi:hypothetical protein